MKNKYYIEEIKENLINIEECESKVRRLLLFFLYKTSSSSKMYIKIESKYYSNIFNEMIESWSGLNNSNIYISNNVNIDLVKRLSILEYAGLNENIINLKYKKIVCFYDKKCDYIENEKYEYLNLIRHLRNSIAHGNVYINNSNKKRLFLFVDNNRKGNVTAKIICTQTDLERWRRIISTYFKQ